MMKKIIIGLIVCQAIILTLTSNLFAAQGYKTRFNPFTGKQDYIIDVSNIEAGSITATGTVTGLVVSFEGGTYDTYLTAGTPTSSEYYYLPLTDGTSSQVLHTNGAGVLSWDTDDTGAGGGDPVLIDSVAVSDASGVDLQGGAGIDITFNAGASPDTAIFITDLTELNTATFGSGTFTTLTFDAGATDPVFTFGSNSLAITNAATFTVGGNAISHAATAFGGDVTGTIGATVIADSVTVTGWTMGASFATTPSADDNDTSLATTAYVQTELNAAGGRSIACASGSCDADAETYTIRFNAGVENVTSNDDDLIQIEPAGAFTITEVACSTNTGTATINFNENAVTTPDIAGTAILSSDIVCDSNRQSSCASGCDVNTISNAGIVANNLISMIVTSVASSPGKLRIHIKGTYDD